MKTYMETNTGLLRTINEDYADVLSKDGVVLLAVADGMGGHQAGEVASEMALKCLRIAFDEFDVTLEKDLAKKWIGRVYEEINLLIHNEAEREAAHAGMGTTLVITLIHPDYILIGNVGDSRAYVVTPDDTLLQITEDHTLVAELFRQGELTEEEVANHPNKNIVLQAMGTEKKISVDIFDLAGGIPSRILLCSDGLSGMIDDDEIEVLLKQDEDLRTIGTQLIAAANENGGKDNISVVLWQHEGGN